MAIDTLIRMWGDKRGHYYCRKIPAVLRSGGKRRDWQKESERDRRKPDELQKQRKGVFFKKLGKKFVRLSDGCSESSMARTKVALEFSNTEKICDLDKQTKNNQAIFVQDRLMVEVEMKRKHLCTLVRTSAMKSREISCVLWEIFCFFVCLALWDPGESMFISR